MRSLRNRRPRVVAGSRDAADVIVVGAGHNGLAAACYMAKAGLDVLVLEGSEVVGGMTATRRAIPEAPDHWINEGSIDVTLFNAGTLNRELELHRFGLRQLEVDPQAAFLTEDGDSLCLFRDVDRTLREIRRHSPRDAATYADFLELSDAVLDVLLPYMRSHPTRPSAQTLRSALRLTLKPRQLRNLGELLTISEAELIDRFENPMLRGLLGGIVPMPSLGAPFSAYMHVYYAMCHRLGVHRFAGGTAGLPWALERCLAEHGGRVRTSALVEEVIVERERAAGVRLFTGEELRAPSVLTSCSPKTTLTRLLPAGALEPQVVRRAEHMPTHEAMTIKTDVAYAHKLDVSRHQAKRGDGADLRLPVWVYHTFEQLQQAEVQARAGRLPDTIPTMVVFPAAMDPEQAPDGQDTLWLFSSYVPQASEQEWHDLAPRAAQSILDDLGRYVGGVGDKELGRQVNAPPQLAQRFNAVDGNVFHIDPMVPRFGPLRPGIGLGAYRTPVDGLYLTGAGTHPTPGICGVPGRLAAQVVIDDRGGGGRGSRSITEPSVVNTPEGPLACQSPSVRL